MTGLLPKSPAPEPSIKHMLVDGVVDRANKSFAPTPKRVRRALVAIAKEMARNEQGIANLPLETFLITSFVGNKPKDTLIDGIPYVALKVGDRICFLLHPKGYELESTMTTSYVKIREESGNVRTDRFTNNRAGDGYLVDVAQSNRRMKLVFKDEAGNPLCDSNWARCDLDGRPPATLFRKIDEYVIGINLTHKNGDKLYIDIEQPHIGGINGGIILYRDFSRPAEDQLCLPCEGGNIPYSVRKPELTQKTAESLKGSFGRNLREALEEGKKDIKNGTTSSVAARLEAELTEFHAQELAEAEETLSAFLPIPRAVRESKPAQLSNHMPREEEIRYRQQKYAEQEEDRLDKRVRDSIAHEQTPGGRRQKYFLLSAILEIRQEFVASAKDVCAKAQKSETKQQELAEALDKEIQKYQKKEKSTRSWLETEQALIPKRLRAISQAEAYADAANQAVLTTSKPCKRFDKLAAKANRKLKKMTRAHVAIGKQIVEKQAYLKDKDPEWLNRKQVELEKRREAVSRAAKWVEETQSKLAKLEALAAAASTELTQHALDNGIPAGMTPLELGRVRARAKDVITGKLKIAPHQQTQPVAKILAAPSIAPLPADTVNTGIVELATYRKSAVRRGNQRPIVRQRHNH